MKTLPVITTACLLVLAAGCSADQYYAAGQQWQRNECNRLPDRDAQQRCLDRASVPPDDYRRDRSADTAPARQPAAADGVRPAR